MDEDKREKLVELIFQDLTQPGSMWGFTDLRPLKPSQTKTVIRLFLRAFERVMNKLMADTGAGTFDPKAPVQAQGKASQVTAHEFANWAVAIGVAVTLFLLVVLLSVVIYKIAKTK